MAIQETDSNRSFEPLVPNFKHPILSRGQEAMFFRYRELGISVSQIHEDDEFLSTFIQGDRPSMVSLLEQYQTVEGVISACNFRLINRVVNRYRPNERVSIDDIFQSAHFGMIRAMDKYDYRREAKFSTYSLPWIQQSIIEKIYRQGFVLPISRRGVELVNQLKGLQKAFYNVFGRTPTRTEMVTQAMANTMLRINKIDTGIGLLDIMGIEEDIHLHEVTRNHPEVEFIGLLGDATVDVEEEAISQTAQEEIRFGVQSSLAKTLNSLEYAVITAVFGLGNEDEKSPEEVAEDLNIKVDDVNDTIQYALSKLGGDSTLKSMWQADNPIPVLSSYLDVVKELSDKGLRDKQIAQILDITPHSVRTYKNTLRRKGRMPRKSRDWAKYLEQIAEMKNSGLGTTEITSRIGVLYSSAVDEANKYLCSIGFGSNSNEAATTVAEARSLGLIPSSIIRVDIDYSNRESFVCEETHLVKVEMENIAHLKYRDVISKFFEPRSKQTKITSPSS